MIPFRLKHFKIFPILRETDKFKDMIKIFLTIVLIISTSAYTAVNDPDGVLNVEWSAPAYGKTVDHYIFSYDINGVTDSVTGSSLSGFTTDNSVTLENLGDFAVFKVRAVSVDDDTSSFAYSDTVIFSISLDTNDGGDNLPDNFQLSAYPNPVQTASFNLSMKIPANEIYNVAIYDILGRKVKSLFTERMTVGEYSREIINDFAPGIYFAVIKSPDYYRTVKLSIIR